MGIVDAEKSHRQAENENGMIRGSVGWTDKGMFFKNFEDSNPSIAKAGPAFPVFK